MALGEGARLDLPLLMSPIERARSGAEETMLCAEAAGEVERFKTYTPFIEVERR